MSHSVSVHSVAVPTAIHPAFHATAFQTSGFSDVSIGGVRALAAAAGAPGLVIADAADAEAAWSGLVTWARALSDEDRRKLQRHAEATLLALANFVRTLAEHDLYAVVWAVLPLLLTWQLFCDALADTLDE